MAKISAKFSPFDSLAPPCFGSDNLSESDSFEGSFSLNFDKFFELHLSDSLISTSFALSLRNIWSPAIKASYSATLLEQSLSSRNLSLVGIFLGEMIRIPTPVQFLWLEPSK